MLEQLKVLYLQLEIKNPENNISDLIYDFFTPKIGFGNYNCPKCGCKGKKLRQQLCLNLPNYLLLELEDKNKINFRDKIDVPLYNGKNYSYQFFASIYKRKIDFSKKNLNLIVEDNPKLNILLRKIPSNKENKDKSYDLFNFISQIRKKNDNIKFNPNIKYNSDINLGIFPANEWEPNSKLKFENFK